MKKLINFFILRPIWGNGIILMLAIIGVFCIVKMQRSFFPELDPKTIVVSVFYPGASPVEMEEGVTIKIEQAVKGLPGIDEINSNSNENSAQVTIKAFQDADIEDLLSDVENAINSISSFPQGAERPLVTRIKSGGMGSTVAFVGIAGKDENANRLELIDVATKVERDLLNSKEITEIKKSGFPEKEISVNVREDDLVRYNISIQEISSAISQKNLDITAGLIQGGIQEMSIRSNSRGTSEDEISQIQIRASRNGEKITVGDVADVKVGYSDASQESKFNDRPSVSIQIEKTKDQDIKKITDVLHDYRDKFNKENPNYEFVIYFEFNDMLNQRIDLLTSNGIMGLVLVLIVLGLFLNVKLAAWVAFGIPFSFLGMFILGSVYGITINMISLFGMILVVGILVDDGIVIAENIYTHFEKGKSPRQAAIDGTIEVLPSIFSSVITTMVAFSVLLFVEGLEMMREMAFVGLACLAFSLVEAIFILPAHLAHNSILNEEIQPRYNVKKGLAMILLGILIVGLGSYLFGSVEKSIGTLLLPFSLFIAGAVMCWMGLTKSPIEKNIRRAADKAIVKVRNEYFLNAVESFIGRKAKMFRLSFFIPMIITFIAIGMLATKVIGFTFFPNIPPDLFSVEVAYKPGDSKVKTQEFLDLATRIINEENDRIIRENKDTLVRYYTSNLGAASNLGQFGNHTGYMTVFLNNEKSNTPSDTLMDRILRRIQSTDQGKLAQNVFVGGFNRFGKEIEMGLTSNDEKSILLARDMFKRELADMKGVINIKDNMPPGRFEVYLNLRPQAEVFGLNKAEILSQIRTGFFGQEAQRVIIGTDEVKIWVRFPKNDRNSLSDLENMRIRNAAGVTIPLRELADFELGRAPESLKRRNGQRIIKIDAECVDPNKVADINAEIRKTIIPKIEQLYPNVKAISLGQFERSQKTGSSMGIIALIACVFMFAIIALHFNSLSQAFLIMLVLPAGIAGAFLGHGLVGIPISILSIFGMIALLGVLVNDAIVFLDRYNDLLKEGYNCKDAVLEATISRFRPILLTSVTTVAGLLPMIYEKSMQAQFLIPMATSIAYGVLFGTIFILFFYPSAILFWNELRRFFRFLWTWEKVSELDVEPVLKLKKLSDELH